MNAVFLLRKEVLETRAYDEQKSVYFLHIIDIHIYSNENSTYTGQDLSGLNILACSSFHYEVCSLSPFIGE